MAGDPAAHDRPLRGKGLPPAGRPPETPLDSPSPEASPPGGFPDALALHKALIQDTQAQAPDRQPAADCPPEVAQAASDPRRRFHHFILVSKLGAGGMGVVYKAWQLGLSRMVALKFLRSEEEGEGELRFDREARLAAGLSHPNIVQVYEIGREQGRSFFSMQYVDGTTLASLLKSSKPVPLKDLVRILAAAARAVDYAHQQGVIHRDLKPQNIMMDRRGQAFVMDFGIAKSIKIDSSLTGTGFAVGTPSYMPPEQAQGEGAKSGPWSDVYSLGAILYEIGTGRPPFQGSRLERVLLDVIQKEPLSPRRLNRKFPGELETIALKALEKDPARRYPSAGEFAAELGRWIKGEPILSRPAGALTRLFRRVRKHKAVIGGLLAATLALAALAALWIGQRNEKAVRAEALRPYREALAAFEEADRIRLMPAAVTSKYRSLLHKSETFAGKSLKIDPSFADGHYLLGMTLLRLGTRPTTDQAIEEFTRAIKIDPAHLLAYRARGRARLELLYERYGVSAFGESGSDRRIHFEFLPRDAGYDTLRAAVVGDLEEAGRLSTLAFEKKLLEGSLQLIAWRPGHPAALDQARTSLEQAHELAPNDPYPLFLLGRVHLSRGDRAQAAESLARAAQLAPNDFDVLYQTVLAFCYADRPKEALGLINRAIDLYPDQAHLIKKRGDLLQEQGDEAGAVRDYEKSFSLAPAESLALVELGYLHYRQKRYPEALEKFERALKEQPANATLHEGRAATLVELGRLEEAEAEFDLVISRRGDALAYSNRGTVRSRRGNYAGASGDFERALQISPDQPDVHFSMGQDALRRTKPEEAARSLKLSLEHGRKTPDATLWLGVALYRSGRYAEALPYYEKALELLPNDLDAHIGLGETLFHLERYPQALGHLEEAVRQGEKGTDCLFILGECQRLLKRIPQAEEAYTQVLKLDKNHADAYARRGWMRCELGRLDEGLADYLECLRLQPEDTATLREIALIHYHRQDFDKALEWIEKAIAGGRSDADAWTLRGESLRHLDRYPLAEEAFTRALAQKPDDPTALFYRARVRYEQGKKEAGHGDLEAALRIDPGFAPAIGQRGIFRVREGRRKEAAEDLERAIRLMPSLQPTLQSYLDRARGGNE